MKTILALLCLGSFASAEIHELTITGILDHGSNTDFFGVGETAPFIYRLQYDDAAEDENPSPTFGEYESDGLWVTLDFASYHFAAQNTEVRVYSGEGGVYGVTFGNADAFAQNGLELSAYFGLYGSFIQPFDRSVTPDDSLRWLAENQNSAALEISSYAYVSGNSPIGSVRFQQSGDLVFTDRVITVVPEPSVLLAMITGYMVLASRRKV